MLNPYLRWVLAVVLMLWLTACAMQQPRPVAVLPPLRLAPAALGQDLALQQRLRFSYGSTVREMDALLEADADEVRLLVQALGQTGVRLFWDGNELRQQRAAWLPKMVRAERVLDDLQFSLWPAVEIQRVLPPGWTLRETGPLRELLHDGQAWLSTTYLDWQHLHLVNLAEGYQLEIDSIRSMDADDEGLLP